MALIYADTTLVPSKLELLAEWLPTQPWFTGDPTKLTRVSGYRLDDPEGEVGIDGILVSAGDDRVYHVPITYRGAPLDGGEAHLIGTMEHGVLGTRWVTEAAGDPVFRAVVAQVIAQGGSGSEELIHQPDGGTIAREQQMPIHGSGQPGAQVPELWAAEVSLGDGASVAATGLATMRVIHAVDAGSAAARGAAGTLTATWPGQDTPVVIATLD
ncbi:CG0192-related protein [Leucobacter komagatae]|uniref:Maltokinase N-terminal cap domain-containing protein n=1 Tax=Leucobacter komagatae TaxID=55969 RepID=A0A0D0IUW6_9MICO|nr:hypothetical protein [Leucobacter komagatae]KIP53383.1 hypothetical protein SD72_03950 [Leucobacter komagatae]